MNYLTNSENEVHVRQATIDDLDTLVNFTRALAQESEQKELEINRVRAGVQFLLEENFTFGLVADKNNCIVGMIFVGGREWSDWSNGQHWWITGVYVIPEERHTGVAKALYRTVRELARNAVPKVIGLRGCVQANNLKGQMSLTRLGRSDSGYLVFEERFDDK